jgi:hypothetical protein
MASDSMFAKWMICPENIENTMFIDFQSEAINPPLQSVSHNYAEKCSNVGR